MPIINNEILKNIRLIAIDNSNSRSIEWYVEQAYRYYSRTYFTPLHEVKKLNPLEVLQVFMEDECINMPPEDRQAMKDQLFKMPQPMLDISSYEEEQIDEMDDEKWVQQQMAMVAEQEKQKNGGNVKTTNNGPSMADAAQAAMRAMQNLYKNLNQQIPENLEGELKFDKENKE
jgi:hypothetical protein